MPRAGRIVLPGVLHHVTQRGNYQQNIFLNESDFKHYSGLIERYAFQCGIRIFGYCLMTNHVHFIVEPSKKNSLARFFSIVHMRYSQYFNKRHNRKGHLWQGRFFSCFMDWPYVYHALRYVENNPVRVQMVRNAWEYPYSSALAHVGQKGGLIGIEKSFEMSPEQWKKYLCEQELTNDEIQYKTHRGLGIGDKLFLLKGENKTGRNLLR